MFQSAMSALEKLSSFLAEEPEVAEPEHPHERAVESVAESATGVTEGASGTVQGALVELDSAVFGYTSDRHALKETTLRIEPGTTVALVGATGAGKSTIAKLVARFYDVSAGQVRIDGVDVRQLADVQLRHEVLMLTQEVFLFSTSILENIRMGNPQACDEQVKLPRRRWELMRSLSVCVTATSRSWVAAVLPCRRVSVSWCPLLACSWRIHGC